jgi:CDP-diglyceride synthetase
MNRETSYVSFPKVVLITFTMIGIITKLILGMFISSNDGSFGSANTSIWGNLIIIISLISYLCIDLELQKETIYPLSLLIMMLLWDTTISYKYFERINNQEIPNIYYSWSFFSNLMILSFILLMLYNLLYDNNDKGKISGFLYIIGVFSLFIIGIQQTILDNFMVDSDN